MYPPELTAPTAAENVFSVPGMRLQAARASTADVAMATASSSTRTVMRSDPSVGLRPEAPAPRLGVGREKAGFVGCEIGRARRTEAIGTPACTLGVESMEAFVR